MKKLMIVLGLLVVPLAGAAYWVSNYRSHHGSEEGFTLVEVEWGPLTEAVSATGVVQPLEVFAVGSELSGRVVKVYADFNQTVAENQPLLQLDDRMARIKLEEAELAIRMAEADLEKAKALHERAGVALSHWRELVRRETGSQIEVDKASLDLKTAAAVVATAEVNVAKAKAARDLAQLGLDLTTVRAPAAGTIIDRKVVVGQMIAPPTSGQLFTLASDLSRMHVIAQVAEGDIGKIREQLDVTFTVTSYGEDEVRFHGKVVQNRLVPTSVQAAVFFPAVIEVPNRRDADTKEWQLRPGMTAAVDIIRRRQERTWRIPTAALSLQLPETFQTDAAKAKLAAWRERSDQEDWKPVWMLNEHKKPWPILVRIGGMNAQGQTGIKDGQYNEVLEWDPELSPRPDPKHPQTYPRVILSAPSVHKPGLFERPVKL